MSSSDNFQPNWISPPGDTILDILESKNISLTKFANILEFSTKEISKLIRGEKRLTPELATQLSQILGTSSAFWLNRELQYREQTDLIRNLDSKKWLDDLPLKDMIKYKWIPQSGDNLITCLEFFDTTDIYSWRERYSKKIASSAFRISSSFKSNPGSVAAWIRKGELEVNKIECNDWNKELFSKSLNKLRDLTKIGNPRNFVPKLKKICAENGVGVAIVKTPSNCPASGAAKFIGHNKAMILLSMRYLSDDHFWFTFFHEAGHLILHNTRELFLDEIKSLEEIPYDEIQANKFAEDILIPKEFRGEMELLKMNYKTISKFAVKIGVSSGIVVGQLQHNGRIEFNKFNKLKRHYDWSDLEFIE